MHPAPESKKEAQLLLAVIADRTAYDSLSVQWNTCFTCLILFLLLYVYRLCSQINDDDDVRHNYTTSN